MGRKPKNTPMTQSEMIESGKHRQNTSKLYKAEAKQLSDEGIAKSVHKAIDIVNTSGSTGRISLDDTETVRSIIGVYLESCAMQSVIPSMTDIALCLGYTRRNIYYYMKNRKDTETGKFLIQVHDIIANTLADNALKGNVNNITAIFLLKSMYGFREDDDISTDINNTDETEFKSDDYKQKYREIIGDDDDD